MLFPANVLASIEELADMKLLLFTFYTVYVYPNTHTCTDL